MLIKKSELKRLSLWLPLLLFVLMAFAPQVQGQTDPAFGLNFSGDFRLRYENTTNQILGTPLPGNEDARNREVVRFRAGITKKINELFNFGARLATGSSDDPNTTDVTLGNFVDDLEFSLDRLYLELKHKNLFLTGGKFGNPFRRTDIVWDGDVNPQGVAGSYTFSGSGQITSKFTGIYSIVDEQTLAPDSYMWGGQMELSIHPVQDWSVTLAGAYYDYTIKSLANAGIGDTRSNLLTSDGTAYISDFDLLDAIAIVEYRGFGERTPIRFVADFVKNLSTVAEADGEDQGFTLDLYIGRASKKHDRRFRYGYSRVETDAVFAAFSNDNTTIPTNYEQHTVTIDYVALENMTLNLTWYLYRRNELFFAPPGADNEFVSRLRLNVMVKL